MTNKEEGIKGYGHISYIDQIVDCVEQVCSPGQKDWKSELKKNLEKLIPGKFCDGQVLTADDMNLLYSRIEQLNDKIESQAKEISELQKKSDLVKNMDRDRKSLYAI